MFGVDADGNLTYTDSPDLSPAPPAPAGSLYSAPDPPPAPGGGMGIPQGTGGVPGDGTIPGLLLPPAPLMGDVSGGDLTLTTSGDIYIYPDMPDALALDDVRSVTSADVTGLPNATSLQYLEDVARGYPPWYKYMAFKSDASYSQSMVLYIGASGEKTASQDRVNFGDVDRIEVNYTRSGTSGYYRYVKTHYDSYQVPYSSNVFLYTNVVDGYAEFDIPQPGYLGLVSYAALLAFAALSMFLAFRKR